MSVACRGRFRFASIALVLSLAFSTVVGMSCGGPSFSAETRAELQDELEDTMGSRGAPGALTGVWTPEGDWVVTRGEADVGAVTPIKTSDIFRIGSVTKTFTATLVLLLAEDGKLALDDTVDRYVPEFPHGGVTTVRQLLSHTSGLPSWDEDDETRRAVLENPGDWSVERLVEMYGKKPLLFEPGSEYHYSNIGYFLLGYIIEEAGGDTFDNLLEGRIAEPLGLEKTFIPEGPSFPGEVVKGYETKDGKTVEVTGTPAADAVNYELAYTAGGMVSTMEDLRTWAKALATGELLSEEMHEEQLPSDLKPVPGTSVEGGYGLGVSQSDVWLGHNGAIAGFFVSMYYYPEKDATFVAFFNEFNAFDAEENAADEMGYSYYFVDVSRILYPETFKGVSAP